MRFTTVGAGYRAHMRSLLIVSLAVVAASCSTSHAPKATPESTPNAQQLFVDTAAHLGDIRSGRITLHGSASANGKATTFSTSGTFVFEGASLPVADLDVHAGATQLHFVSNGRSAFIERGALRTPIDASTFASFSLDKLHLESWARSAPDFAGSNKIVANLDTGAALHDIAAFLPPLPGRFGTLIHQASSDPQSVTSATRDASMTITSGADDLLRELALTVHMNDGAALQLDASLSDLNGPVGTPSS